MDCGESMNTNAKIWTTLFQNKVYIFLKWLQICLWLYAPLEYTKVFLKKKHTDIYKVKL